MISLFPPFRMISKTLCAHIHTCMHVYDAHMRKTSKVEQPTKYPPEYWPVIIARGFLQSIYWEHSATGTLTSDSEYQGVGTTWLLSAPARRGAATWAAALDTFSFRYIFLHLLLSFLPQMLLQTVLRDCQNPNSHCPWMPVPLTKFECVWVTHTVSSL